MSTKPSHSEEEFFAREEQEKKHQFHEKQKHKDDQAQRELQKNLHFMKCPKCGDDLKLIRISFVDIDECIKCGAMVLDKGELDKLKIADNTVLRALVDVFKKDR